jgi:hypothetical protein
MIHDIKSTEEYSQLTVSDNFSATIVDFYATWYGRHLFYIMLNFVLKYN